VSEDTLPDIEFYFIICKNSRSFLKIRKGEIVKGETYGDNLKEAENQIPTNNTLSLKRSG